MVEYARNSLSYVSEEILPISYTINMEKSPIEIYLDILNSSNVFGLELEYIPIVSTLRYLITQKYDTKDKMTQTEVLSIIATFLHTKTSNALVIGHTPKSLDLNSTIEHTLYCLMLLSQSIYFLKKIEFDMDFINYHITKWNGHLLPGYIRRYSIKYEQPKKPIFDTIRNLVFLGLTDKIKMNF